MARISVTANKLDPKLNTLLIQAHNAEAAPTDVGVMTSETLFKHWDVEKLQWTASSCQVTVFYNCTLVIKSCHRHVM